ncbi:MAG: type IV pilus twitching motility protein PilT [Thermodesulfobacteriota bacterium]
MLDIKRILSLAMQRGASDVHLKVGLPPVLRIHGKLVPVTGEKRLMPEDTKELAFSIMMDRHKEKFRVANEVDLAYGVSGLGRFRVNIFSQRDSIGMVLRTISVNPPTVAELNLPPVIEKIAMEPRGLVLVTGTTGSGKSTTLAAMVNHINNNRNCHIITIEDPIEFLHRDKKAIINQREVGQDTQSFATALRVALRQDPDVILVGEMRDFETIETAILAAETGHLVLSTLHTLDAQETVNRIVAVFPFQQQKQIRLQLATILKGVISQRLVSRADGQGRLPAVEVMLSTARIRECIAEEVKTREIHDAIAQGHTTYGMQTFDQSLMELFRKGMITYEEALRNATNPDDFALKVSGISATSEARWLTEEEAQEVKLKFE